MTHPSSTIVNHPFGIAAVGAKGLNFLVQTTATDNEAGSTGAGPLLGGKLEVATGGVA